MSNNLPADPDLEALVRKLNAAARVTDPPPASDPAPAPRAHWSLPHSLPGPREDLARLLERARAANASDLLLVAGAPPTVRINGRIFPLTEEPLSPLDTAALCSALVPRERRDGLATAGSLDFSFSVPQAGAFRCNVHRERGHWSAAIRLFPLATPDLDQLNLPPALDRFADLEHGLVLVTGPTGSGKTTTLAALMKRILSRRPVHVITIEDPVEYEHPHGPSVVEHVEIGRDATSFAHALRAALRQDPDVLLVGEMRDRESISITVTAAETGHLVLSTLHTGDAVQTVSRILDTYPAGQIEAVRAQLAASLAGIVSQQLLPRPDGAGRVPAVEILWGTHGVRNLIRQGKLERLRAQIGLEQAAGMLSLDQSLALLVSRGLVSPEEARARARDTKEFEAQLGTFR